MDNSASTCNEQAVSTVTVSPSRIVRRQGAHWHGLLAETVQLTSREPFEYDFNGHCHLLIASERAARYEGETLVEGLPRSTLQDFGHKMTFVPAGHAFSGWQKPRVLLESTFFYIDPHLLAVDPAFRFATIDFRPRVFFDDDFLWQIALKLKAQIGSAKPNRMYAEALGAVLAHELVRLNGDAPPAKPAARGGLAAWQQKRIADFIEEHLAEDVPLATLADLARLSTYHFVRAFKQSFGVPPHRYHLRRRVERAKVLLADPTAALTNIALDLGFCGSSAFAATFHRLTGQTPSDYRRSLE